MTPEELLADLAQPLRAGQIDRHQLGHPTFLHGDAIEPIHPRHRDAVMGDHEKTGVQIMGNIVH